MEVKRASAKGQSTSPGNGPQGDEKRRRSSSWISGSVRGLNRSEVRSPGGNGSRLVQLDRDRDRNRVRLQILLVSAVLTVAIDLLVTGHAPTRLQTLPLNLLYGIYASLLAALLIERWAVTREVDRHRSYAYEALGVLGIVEALELEEVAIVVPSFPTGPHPEAGVHGANQRLLQTRLGFAPSSGLRKSANEMGSYSYARRDMLAVADLMRLVGAAGLPQPFIVSDDSFAKALHDIHKTGGALRVKTGERKPNEVRRVRAAVVVGLWSNIVTWMLSDHDAVPFGLSNDANPNARKIRFDSPTHSHESLWLPQESSESRAYGLFARLTLDEFRFVVVGGISSLGTVRLGDLIAHKPSACSALFDADPTDDLWALISCPGEGDRGGAYDVVLHRSCKDYVRKDLRALHELLPKNSSDSTGTPDRMDSEDDGRTD